MKTQPWTRPDADSKPPAIENLPVICKDCTDQIHYGTHLDPILDLYTLQWTWCQCKYCS